VNRAVASTRSAMLKEASTETGIKQKDLKQRTRIKKATAGDLTGVVSFGTKVGVSLGDLSPKVVKNIKSNHGTRKGVSVQMPGEGRVTVPGGWMWQANPKKKLVLARKRSY